MSEKQPLGSIGWVDLTVPDAPKIRDFYKSVVGWDSEGLSMGEYEDYVMKNAAGDGISGVCHQQGFNADQPTGWMIYITVADLKTAMEKVEAGGGKIVKAHPKGPGPGRFAVIEDPAGNVCALFQPAD